MKKIILFIFLVLLITNIVSAGETYKLDFKVQPSYGVGLLGGDRVEFELENSKHTILIKSVDINSVDLAAFTYIDKQNSPFYITINNKKYLKLDVDRDNKDDLYVFYKNSNKTVAYLIFQLPLIANKDLKIFSENTFNKNNYAKIIIIVIIVLIILFLIIILFKKKKKEEINKIS